MVCDSACSRRRLPAGCSLDRRSVLTTGMPPRCISDDCTAAQQGELAARHRNSGSVTVWFMPRTPRCALVMARWVAWRRCGHVAGIARGPDEDKAWPKPSRAFDAREYAKHLRDLYIAPDWPAGGAPIVLTSVSAAKLAAVVHFLGVLLPAAEIARLKPCDMHLSRRPGRGQPSPVQYWDYVGFCLNNPLLPLTMGAVGNPGTSTLLVERVLHALVTQAGLPDNGEHRMCRLIHSLLFVLPL